MAPNPRVAMAFRAMRGLGITEEKVKPVLKSLLKLYDKNWELIEDENYRVLADAIFEYDETEVVEHKKKNENPEQEDGLEEEAQVEDEPERPLKRLRLRFQESQVSPSLSNSTPELAGTSYIKPTVEESNDRTESPRSNTENPGTESNSFSAQPLIRNKGKQPVLHKPLTLQEKSEPSQPGATKIYESDSISSPARLRDKGKEILTSPVVHREKRPISLGIEPGIILLPKQKIPTSHCMIEPKDEPFTDDMPQYEVPIAVMHPESLTKGSSSIGNGVTREPHGPEPLASQSVNIEDKGDGARASSSATMASCELASVPEESAANLEIASSLPFGEETTNATPIINIMYKSNSPDALDGRDMPVAVSPSDESVHVQPLGVTLPSSFNGSDDCLQPDKSITENCSVPENEKVQNCIEVTNSQRSLHDRNDIAKGQERVVISFVNEINSEGPPSFHYIPRNVVFQNAYVNFSLARIGDNRCCSTCFGNCLSSSTPCACARETGGDFAYTLEGLVKKDLLEECISMNRDPQKHCHFYCEECPLERSKNGDSLGPCKGHLVRKFIKECWWKCGCTKQCGNRVVQRGINRNLQVFMTAEGKGWGLRTLEDLPKGAFVCEYVGEVLTNAELYERVSQSSSSEEHAYPVLLDADWGSEGVLKDEEALCLDATFFGNVARFINHRCVDSNLVEIPVEVETPDHHYYHLAFFTTRKIKAMEELTWDYGIDFDDDKHPVKAFQCRCGSKLCRSITHSSPTTSKQSTPSPTTSKTKQTSTSNGNRQRGNFSQYRSTALEKIMKTIQLKERHKTALKKTPFWDFIEAFISNRVHPSHCRKFDNKVMELLHTYKPKHKAFQLGGKIVRLRTSDISLIFGIQSGKIPMSLSPVKKPNTSFITRRLEDIERMSTTIIKNKLLDALKGNRKVDIEDVVRLLCLFLCVTLFFATRGNSIGWAFIRYIENLEDMRNYAWSEAIHHSLMSSIEKSYHSPGKLTGCVPALLYWLCEHTTILQPLEQTQYPRFLKWDIGKLQEELTLSRLNNLTNKEVHGAELKRTKQEKSLQTREVEEEEKGEVTKRTTRNSGSKSRATSR